MIAIMVSVAKDRSRCLMGGWSFHAIRNVTLALSFMLVAPINSVSSEEWGTGQAIFNSNCAICHGRDGRGGRGPNLFGSLRNGNLDSNVETVIRNGLPGTAMPKFNFEEEELQALMRYVQSLRHAAPSTLHPEGDRTAGKQLYDSQGCPGCHEIGNEGSTLGPNLTRIGAARSYEYLKTSIVDPSADVPDGNRTVKIVTRDGRQYQGIWVNEDSFTVQIRLRDESFASFDKQNLKEALHEKDSLMPSYHFRETDLRNLLAYLSSLVGAPNPASETQPKRRQR
jgi:putative heme-binding domain-containing protein